ncbi:MAG: glycosyltransferase family 2 protein [Muribaculaceae bacterium]|nr:glycosyltransferase family 2 protein [Muribaculaceae bacterium]
MKISLVITTYNDTGALELTLKSILRQKRMPDEVIIGDDGSTAETRELIDRYRPIFDVPLVHVWQQDHGFRLAMIRNKAIAAAKGEYIIQTDGDIILHPRFVDDHERMAKPGFYLKGGRCVLGKELSSRLRSIGIIPDFKPWTRGIESKRLNTLRLPVVARYLAPRYRRKERGVGCNLSFFKKDFIDVNGYDEFFKGWGAEDNDFLRRLLLKGLEKRHLKFAGLTFHLWHKENSRVHLEKNFKYSIRDDGNIRCPDGCDKYL